MPCYSPVEAWYSNQTNPSGKRSLVFSPANAVGSPIKIPCGGCVGCRLERSRQWAVRLLHESQLHVYRWFLTLTYSDAYLPPDGGLVKRDYQLFLKRLRKARPNLPIQYFLVGEYGETNPVTKIVDGGLYRPHYHAIIFGVDFPDMRQHTQNEAGDPLFVSAELDALWGMGDCYIGAVTSQSIGYVARYSMKKVTGDLAEKHYQRINPDTGEVHEVLPEFARMSLKRPIGSRWYEKYSEEVHATDSVVIRGREQKPPRYYDKKLADSDPERLATTKDTRKRSAQGRRFDNTPDRLSIRRIVKEAQISRLVRKL